MRTFANAFDAFEPPAHKAPTAGHEMLAPLRAREEPKGICCDVIGDFLDRKPVSDAEHETAMRFYDMTRRKRALSYTPLDRPARASNRMNRTPCDQQRGKPDKPARRSPATRNASPPHAHSRDCARPATARAVRR